MSKRQPTARTWQGVRMRRISAMADPDGTARLVTLPAAWEPSAAAALAALAPGGGAVTLEAASAAWVDRVARCAAQHFMDQPVAERLHGLLLLRRGTAAAPLWSGLETDAHGFVLNLAAFHDADFGFDADGLRAAAEFAASTMRTVAPAAASIELGIADLAGLLACLGLDYDSEAARAVGACVACLVRAGADAGSAAHSPHAETAARGTSPPPPPEATPVPGLAQAALAAWRSMGHAQRRRVTMVVAVPGPAEALLGVETGGIAPAFSPIDDAGGLTRTARAYLAARGIGAEAALADTLAGRSPIPTASLAAHRAMHNAVSPYIDGMPTLPIAARPALTLVAPQPGASPRSSPRRDLPARRKGYAQKVSVGGHKLYLRTGEYEDGTLGEVAIGLTRESAAFRGLMDCLAGAVSLGLQHGVPLDAFVDALTLTQFGPAGVVEGDPDVGRASSLVDYVFRHLAASYLKRTDIPEPILEEPIPAGAVPETGSPLLPMEFPREDVRTRRRALRLVAP